MEFDPMPAIGLVVTGIFSAFLGLLFLAVLQRKMPRQPDTLFPESSGNAEYLFDDKIMIDATPAGRSLLPRTCQNNLSAWPGLINYLEPRFPGVSKQLETLSAQGTLTLGSVEDEDNAPLLMRAELRGGLTRITVLEAEAKVTTGAFDPLTRRAIREELEQLRQISAKAPLPIWRESAEGEVIWANATYLNLVTDRLEEGEDLSWPLQKLFAQSPMPEQTQGERKKLVGIGDQKDCWFDLYEFADSKTRLIYALPADHTVKAEEGLRAFMQTLTKTFAHLSTGLAIFDKDRKLVLFNPSLIDLTGLAPDLLTKRPSLSMFFDALRDSSMIPEPRDYKSWRNQITDLDQAAASGLYEETWSLPSGQTYRVIGRPHPNGALALSIEDISSEMSQTRRYRADLELGQAVIDEVGTAIAVFSTTGMLVMSNAAYAELWGHDPAASLSAEGSISTICDYWRSATAPSTIWDRIEDFSNLSGPRDAWEDEARLSDGRLVNCRFSPLAGGATMATFALKANEMNEREPRFSGNRKKA